MKVKFLKSIAGAKYSYAKGQKIDLPKVRADVFVKAGIAEPVGAKESEDIETATAPPAKETTSTRKGRKKNADNTGNSEKAT